MGVAVPENQGGGGGSTVGGLTPPPRPRPRASAPSRLDPEVGKRVFDLAVAGLLLVAAGPVLVLAAVAIRVDSPGPVLFRQQRLGRGGRPFWMWKFRTMVDNAEALMAGLEAGNESRGGVLFKIQRDPRVTRVGYWLRRTSVDELPQLLNVLRGTMSLVGPRPLPPRDSALLEAADGPRYRKRLDVLPGLTGPWQVSGRSGVGHERMLELDVQYVEQRTFWRDLRVLARTIPVVAACRGAC